MKPARRVSKSGLELIKRFEGYRRSAARLADGRWTVGYGHVKFARDGVTLSEADAELLLIYDLFSVAEVIDAFTETPLTQNQFDALSSFVFNVGLENFRTSSVLRFINAGELARAAYGIEAWRRAAFEDDTVVVEALIRRRAAEKALFLAPDADETIAPTPVLPPRLDAEAEIPVLSGPAADLQVLLDGAAVAASRAGGGTLFPANPPQIDETPQSPSEAPAEIPPSSPAAPEIVETYMVPNDVVRLQQQVAPPRPDGLVRLVGFSAAGLVLFGASVFWRLQTGARNDIPFGQQGLIFLAGLAGVVCIFYAAYLLLERFADAQD